MALQAALPPTDSKEFRRSELMRRLDRTRSRSESRVGRGHDTRGWDPAEYLGVSPYVMMGICAQIGAVLGLLVFSTFQVASRPGPAPAPVPVSIQPGVAAEAPPALFVTVAELPQPAQAVDDYYFYLRQGMFDRAWEQTDDTFRAENYGGDAEVYQQAWAGAEAMEVLSLDLVWQGDDEAHVLGEIQEGVSGRRFRYTYVLRFDEATSAWKIHSVAPTG